ncbi:MBL fold metallo-hydrolase [Demequina sp.]|uniref:MBL fold metallo-hydrolase n=1 Tax=Demequina sp. TaxID=2050685 RepID=UPI003D0CD234
MAPITATLVGGPTLVFTYAGLTVITDPTFSAPGDYGGLTKTRGPAVPPQRLGQLDLALVSHDHHPDNLDDEGRAVLAQVPVALTTTAGAPRVPGTLGLEPWTSVTVGPVTVTAVPALHGPDGVAEHTGPVIGFVLEADGHPTVYFSGDNSEVAVAREIAAAFPHVDVAILCVGAARVPNRGPDPLTLDAERAAQVAELWPGALIVPVHIEDWAHFSEPREAFQENWSGPSGRLLLLEPGVRTELL